MGGETLSRAGHERQKTSTEPGTDGETPAETERRRRHNNSTLGSATRYCTAEQQLLHASHALAIRLGPFSLTLSEKDTFWDLVRKPYVLAKKCTGQTSIIEVFAII